MSKYTPGPWTFGVPEGHPGYADGMRHIQVYAGERFITDVGSRTCKEYPAHHYPGACEVTGAATVCSTMGDVCAEQEANARLIAAAPDLLEAAKEALAGIEQMGSDWSDRVAPLLAAAIAKATGATV